MTDIGETDSPDDSARALLRERDYLLMWVARFCGVLGTAAQSATMGWQIYEIARVTGTVAESALWVGILGLATFLPLMALTLPAGEVADRHTRRNVLLFCYVGEIATALILAVTALTGTATVWTLIGVAFLFGIARAFRAPAGTALAPMLVPRNLLPRAIAWNSLAFQSGTIVGLGVSGFLIAISPAHAYGFCMAFYAVAFILYALIRTNTKPESQNGSRIELMKEGLRFVWGNKIIFGAISLDLAAVLLGGVTALLPVFARDVLFVGAEGYGFLRAAPTIGAAMVAFVIAIRPPRQRAGLTMFAGVAVFGVATLVFAVSKSFLLSMMALAVLGGADMLSVYVRQTLMQIVTPDPMRGRVASVSFLFIGASNELGEFESGVTARLFGPVGAAVFGGVASLFVTGLWARWFPELRKFDRL